MAAGSLSPEQSQAVRRADTGLLVLIGRIRAGQVTQPQLAGLRVHLLSRLQEARWRLLGTGLGEAIVRDVQLPVLALLDEVALSVDPEWSLLQEEWLGTRDARGLARRRVEDLLDAPQTPVELLEVYARGMAWGFLGQEVAAPGFRLRLRERIAESAPPVLAIDLLTPNRQRLPPPVPPLWSIAGLCLALLFVFYMGMSVIIRSRADHTARAIAAPLAREVTERR